MTRKPDELIFETEDAFGALTFVRRYGEFTGEARTVVQLTPWNGAAVTYDLSVEQVVALAKFIVSAVQAFEIITDPDPPRKPTFKIGQRVKVKEERLKDIPSCADMMLLIDDIFDENTAAVTRGKGQPTWAQLPLTWLEATNE